MEIAGKKHGQLEPAGAAPSFSASYNSSGRNRKISIGVSVQEALAGKWSAVKKNGEVNDPPAQSHPGRKNKQENISRAKLENGQQECSIQKTGEWVSRSFRKGIESVSLYENRGAIVQSKDGVAKKVDWVTYARKCKDKNNPENGHAFVSTAIQEMHVRKKNIINCKSATEESGHIQTKRHTQMGKNNPENIDDFFPTEAQEMHVPKKSIINCKLVTEENGDIQTKQPTEKDKNNPENVDAFVSAPAPEMHVATKSIIDCKAATEENGHIQTKEHTESLRTKLWDALQTVLSHPDDGNADTKEQSKQSSDTIESDSEKPIPIQKPSKPITHLASQRKGTKKVPALINESNVYQFHPSSRIQEKPPQQNVFAFTDEEARRKYAVPPNRKPSGFKKKYGKKRDLIKPLQIQDSPEPVAEKEDGKNEEKQKQQYGSPVRPSPSLQNHLSDKHVPSPVNEVNDTVRGVFDVPMVRNGKEDARQDDSTTLTKAKSGGKGFLASSEHKPGAEALENSPTSKVTDARGESIHRIRKRCGDKQKLETSETNTEKFYVSKKSDGEKKQLDVTATRKDNSVYYKKPRGNKEDMVNGGIKEVNFQNSPVQDDNLHVSPEIPDNMDDTTEDNKTLSATPPLMGRRETEKNSSSSEQQNAECRMLTSSSDDQRRLKSNNVLSPPELVQGLQSYVPEKTSTSEAQEKPLFLLRRNIRVRHQATMPKVPSIYTSAKGKEESVPLQVESQQSQDALTSAIVQFASGLEKFKIKMQSHTKRKTSDILSATTEKVQARLQNAESQIHMDLEKLTYLSRAKRKKLETKLQEKQELLQKIHAKFKEDVDLHIQECVNVLGKMEADQTELRATAEKQKASHRKLLLQVQEEIGAHLGDAESRICALNKEANTKMQQLKRALSGVF